MALTPETAPNLYALVGLEGRTDQREVGLRTIGGIGIESIMKAIS